jgi:hypothetical protein
MRTFESSSSYNHAPDSCFQVTDLQELLKAKGLDVKVGLIAPLPSCCGMPSYLFGQGPKAVLVARLVAAAPAAAPAPAPATAPAPTPAAAAPAAATPAAAAAVPVANSSASAAAATPTSAAADDEAARLQRRMEKFGVPAAAAAPAASNADAERIKKRGMSLWLHSAILHILRSFFKCIPSCFFRFCFFLLSPLPTLPHLDMLQR